MYTGFYAALTGLVSKFDALDLIAHNFANVDTTGYKSQTEFCRTFTATLDNANNGSLDRAVNDYGVLGGATTNLQAVSIQSTGNPLDLARESKGG